MTILCPECTRRVSKQAQVCPGCGLPSPSVEREKRDREYELANRPKSGKGAKILKGVAVAGAIILGAFLIGSISKKK